MEMEPSKPRAAGEAASLDLILTPGVQETAEEAAKEQETAISETNPDNCVLNKPESSEVEEKLSDSKTELQVLLPTESCYAKPKKKQGANQQKK
ncbi:hypothetical protein DUI87_13878 [Hirundo rustica rustica]|uniref:Uncharacterized protein n=1 Tax=Hirundo rustica rustica TaxID=333673 RepID=A0A3M0KCD3_HIRRU|nr:hypothetical protein DUI87_13878 [Hirundo rustica rustica]